MNKELKLKGIILLIALLTLPLINHAQTLAEAQKMYNAGVTAKSEGNIQEAINQFVACVDACQILYDEEEDETAEELMYQVQPIIPSLYLQLGSEQIKNQKIQEGLENLYKARETAETYGEDGTKKKTEAYLAKVHYTLGGSKYKKGDLDGALSELDKSLAVDENYVKSHYMKAVVYKKQGNEELFKSATDKGIAAAEAKKDNKYKEKLKSGAVKYYLKKGQTAKGASKYDEAISSLKEALNYDATNVNAHYLLSTTYLAKGSYGEAVSSGQKAVEHETGGGEATAKIYMVIAEAQQKKGDTSAACATYKKAAVGQYAELANYRIQHELKCE